MGQAESPEAKQFDGGENPVRAAVEIAQTVESLDGQGQTGNQPDQQQALGMVMADVFQSVAILGVIEPLIFNLPAALRQAEQRAATQARGGEIRQPEGLEEGSIGLVLAIKKDSHGRPVPRFGEKRKWFCARHRVR